MPEIESRYLPVRVLRNGHFQSILPTLLRRINSTQAIRERISTPDSDFIDLDWRRSGSKKLVVILHGLEGSAQSHYVLGMSKILGGAGFDTVAMNFRGCSGEPNLKLADYHSGKSEDLKVVLDHIKSRNSYDTVSLVGFSVGGNIVLKYLGEEGSKAQIAAALAVSVPCDLKAAAYILADLSNIIYMRYFLRRLKAKVASKVACYPGQISLDGFSKIRTFEEFDSRYTASLNGFASADDYWARASSLPLLSKITVPTLLLSAKDDPFLTSACFPHEIAKNSPHLHLETPQYGGHVGFLNYPITETTWAERRAVEFLSVC